MQENVENVVFYSLQNVENVVFFFLSTTQHDNMKYAIERDFFNEEGDTAKDWKTAECVCFMAWVNPEDADKMQDVCTRRARRWERTHVNCHVFPEERYISYNGQVVVSCSVYKNK